MTLKWIGAILIIAACGGFGFLMAAAYRKEEASLRQLADTLEFMAWELEYRLTPLPELCRKVSRQSTHGVRTAFQRLADELEGQVSPDVQHCMAAALAKSAELPGLTREAMEQLGASLGRFDLSGQLKGLEAVGKFCARELERLGENRDNRLRSYQTLGLCAGAALAILFI